MHISLHCPNEMLWSLHCPKLIALITSVSRTKYINHFIAPNQMHWSLHCPKLNALITSVMQRPQAITWTNISLVYWHIVCVTQLHWVKEIHMMSKWRLVSNITCWWNIISWWFWTFFVVYVYNWDSLWLGGELMIYCPSAVPWGHSRAGQQSGGIVALTHWGRMTPICVSKLTIIGSHNDLSPSQCQAIIWTNAGILLIGPLGTNSVES